MRTIRLAGYVNSTPDFHAQSQVMSGASDCFPEVFGEKGRHTRMAVGVSALPYNVAVEAEGLAFQRRYDRCRKLKFLRGSTE